MLKDLIENKENMVYKILRELKYSEVPTILYGAGKSAKVIYDSFNTKIKIDYIAISDDHYKDNLMFLIRKFIA